MPYIHPDQRESLDPLLRPLFRIPLTPGQLNYVITRIINAYWLRCADYQAIDEITGVLETAKFEFLRRVASSYEDMKKEKNGDVYGS